MILTHEHQDHVRGAKRLALRHDLPIYATAGTLNGGGLVNDCLPFEEGPRYPESRTVRSGEPFEIVSRGDGPAEIGFRVEAFRIPHDAADPVGYMVEDAAGHRLGLLSDIGTRSQLAWGRLRDLDCLILETNHDLQMLRTSPYPWHVKQRIASRHGHLSNREAAQGLPDLICDRLRTVMPYHLSQTNNQPTLAAEAVGEALDREGSSASVVLTEQNQPTAWVEVEP